MDGILDLEYWPLPYKFSNPWLGVEHALQKQYCTTDTHAWGPHSSSAVQELQEGGPWGTVTVVVVTTCCALAVYQAPCRQSTFSTLKHLLEFVFLHLGR